MGGTHTTLTIQNSHPGPPPCHVHGRNERPGVVLWVVAFHAVEAVPGLGAANDVQEATQLANCCLVPAWKTMQARGPIPIPCPAPARRVAGQARGDIRILRGAQLAHALVTGSNTSQFFRPFWP